MSLEKEYFEKIYSKDSLIDGDYNAKSHARYIHSLFSLVEIEVSSLIDFGFGKASLLKELIRFFEPGMALAIDSSTHIFDEVSKKAWVSQKSFLELKNESLEDFTIPKKVFDLGVCNSVLQYIKEDQIESVIEKMSYSCRYLYLHVPSKEDYARLRSDIDFHDSWAVSREDQFYRQLLSSYFVKVGWGLWESKTNVEADASAFFDSLYRD